MSNSNLKYKKAVGIETYYLFGQGIKSAAINIATVYPTQVPKTESSLRNTFLRIKLATQKPTDAQNAQVNRSTGITKTPNQNKLSHFCDRLIIS